MAQVTQQCQEYDCRNKCVFSFRRNDNGKSIRKVALLATIRYEYFLAFVPVDI